MHTFQKQYILQDSILLRLAPDLANTRLGWDSYIHFSVKCHLSTLQMQTAPGTAIYIHAIRYLIGHNFWRFPPTFIIYSKTWCLLQRLSIDYKDHSNPLHISISSDQNLLPGTHIPIKNKNKKKNHLFKLELVHEFVNYTKKDSPLGVVNNLGVGNGCKI